MSVHPSPIIIFSRETNSLLHKTGFCSLKQLLGSKIEDPSFKEENFIVICLWVLVFQEEARNFWRIVIVLTSVWSLTSCSGFLFFSSESDGNGGNSKVGENCLSGSSLNCSIEFWVFLSSSTLKFPRADPS